MKLAVINAKQFYYNHICNVHKYHNIIRNVKNAFDDVSNIQSKHWQTVSKQSYVKSSHQLMAKSYSLLFALLCWRIAKRLQNSCLHCANQWNGVTYNIVPFVVFPRTFTTRLAIRQIVIAPIKTTIYSLDKYNENSYNCHIIYNSN